MGPGFRNINTEVQIWAEIINIVYSVNDKKKKRFTKKNNSSLMNDSKLQKKRGYCTEVCTETS